MLTTIIVIALLAWIGSGHHAIYRCRKARQRRLEGASSAERCLERFLASILGPVTYWAAQDEIAGKLAAPVASLPGCLETEKRLSQELDETQRQLAAAGATILAAKALADGTEPVGKTPEVGDLELACANWRRLKESQADLELSLEAARVQVAWLRGLYQGTLEANGISASEIEESLRLQLPAPAAEIKDDDASLLAKLGDPGHEVLEKLLFRKSEQFFRYKDDHNGKSWDRIDNVPLLLMDVLPNMSEKTFFDSRRGEFGAWLTTEYRDHRLGVAVGTAATIKEAMRLIGLRLKQAIEHVESQRLELDKYGGEYGH